MNLFKYTMIGCIALALYAAFLSLYPFKTIEFYNSPFPVNNENKEVCYGETVRFQAHYIRYQDTPVTVIRHIYQKPEDSPTGKERDFTYPTIESKFPAGEHDVEISRDVVSVAAPKGWVVLRMTVTFPVNPLQNQEFDVETQPFFIKDCEMKPVIHQEQNNQTTTTTETTTTTKSEGQPTEVKVESKSESKSTNEESEPERSEDSSLIETDLPLVGKVKVL